MKSLRLLDERDVAVRFRVFCSCLDIHAVDNNKTRCLVVIQLQRARLSSAPWFLSSVNPIPIKFRTQSYCTTVLYVQLLLVSRLLVLSYTSLGDHVISIECHARSRVRYPGRHGKHRSGQCFNSFFFFRIFTKP